MTDRAYLQWLYRCWFVMLMPYSVIRLVVTDWATITGLFAVAIEVLALLLAVAATTPVLRLYFPVHRPWRAPESTVDCLLPTHLEDVALIEPTVLAACRVDGIRHVIVLCNSDRSEVRALCRRAGARYVARNSNAHAKAGNLNHGLQHTDSEFLLVLDADHIARPDLLHRVMGQFANPRIAYVQSPQTYYNTESFLFRPLHGHPSGWSEQQRFYQCEQLGRNRWEAALFMGSSAVLRRSALDSIGGFAQGVVAEDVHTSIRLRARGWRSTYTPEPLAFGLEAVSLREYHNQRRRWAAGAFNLLLRSPDSPLWARGMDIQGRWIAVAYIVGHLAGVARLGWLMIAALTLLTSTSLVTVPMGMFGPLFVMWWGFSILLTHLLSRGSSRLRYADEFSFASMFTHLSAAAGLVVRIRRFAWSAKIAPANGRHWVVAALCASAGLCCLTLTFAVFRICQSGLSGLLVWGGLLAAAQIPGAVGFLGHLYLAGRPSRPAPHERLRGLDKYRYVIDEFAANRIGRPPMFLDQLLAAERRSAPNAGRAG